jgi:pimeloyl-ACP methyl ester carboxylesterase
MQARKIIFYMLRHVNFKTSDDLKLPGLLYEPDKKTKKVAIYLHGNGGSSIFYKSDENKIIAEKLNKKDISYFPFNNRGAGFIQKFRNIVDGKKVRRNYGMTYELIKDCVIDIDAAIEFLKTKGYRTFYLIGSSTGANKVVVYDKYKKNNDISKYILLAGGDDTGIYFEMMGKNKFEKALKISQEKINQGKGMQLAPKTLVGEMIISYQSLYDTINPEGDYNIFPYFFSTDRSRPVPTSNIHIQKELFREFKQINKPTLVIYGENDEYCFGAQQAVDILRIEAQGKNNFTFKIIPEADHGFTDKEKELAQIIAEWL